MTTTKVAAVEPVFAAAAKATADPTKPGHPTKTNFRQRKGPQEEKHSAALHSFVAALGQTTLTYQDMHSHQLEQIHRNRRDIHGQTS